MVLLSVSFSIVSLVLIFVGVAFFTLLERKLISLIQSRVGPNKVSIIGIVQPLLDALKLFLKEDTSPEKSNVGMFWAFPMVGMFLSLILFLMCEESLMMYGKELSILSLFVISGLSIYPIYMVGWSSNSPYTKLSSERCTAQSVSYEVVMFLAGLIPILILFSFDFKEFSEKYNFLLIIGSSVLILWMISILAETFRSPFDHAEGESELVSGINIEYGSGLFALLFLAEYMNMMFFSMITVVLFTPYMGSVLMKGIFTLLFMILYILIRSLLPRLRYDSLMGLCWQTLLPMILSFVFLFSLI